MLRTLIITSAVLALPLTAQAGATDGWGGEASLSGSMTSGNTRTTDVGLALHLTKDTGLWKHSFDSTYDLGKFKTKIDDPNNPGTQIDETTDTKDRLYLGYKLDRQINDRLYAYGNANYFSDKFGSYEEGYFAGAGFGYKMIQGEPVMWNLEGGVGYRSQTLQDAPDSETGVALRGFSDFDYKFSESVSLYNDTEVVWSSDDTYLWNDIGITANLAGNLAARFSFRVDHHTDVPMGVEKTDTITRAALVYTIK